MAQRRTRKTTRTRRPRPPRGPIIPPYRYDPRKVIKAAQLREELREVWHDDQWSTFRGGTIDSHLNGIGGDCIPATLEQCMYLCELHNSIVKRAVGMKCGRHALLAYSQMMYYCNARGGGALAFGRISGNPISFHNSRHRLMIARLDTGKWKLFDPGYVGPDPGRWVVDPSDHDRGLSGLVLGQDN